MSSPSVHPLLLRWKIHTEGMSRECGGPTQHPRKVGVMERNKDEAVLDALAKVLYEGGVLPGDIPWELLAHAQKRQWIEEVRECEVEEVRKEMKT